MRSPAPGCCASGVVVAPAVRLEEGGVMEAASKLSRPACGRCVFYEYGECFRFPPSTPEMILPDVHVDGWCGEYRFDRCLVDGPLGGRRCGGQRGHEGDHFVQFVDSASPQPWWVDVKS